MDTIVKYTDKGFETLSTEEVEWEVSALDKTAEEVRRRGRELGAKFAEADWRGVKVRFLVEHPSISIAGLWVDYKEEGDE